MISSLKCFKEKFMWRRNTNIMEENAVNSFDNLVSVRTRHCHFRTVDFQSSDSTFDVFCQCSICCINTIFSDCLHTFFSISKTSVAIPRLVNARCRRRTLHKVGAAVGKSCLHDSVHRWQQYLGLPILAVEVAHGSAIEVLPTSSM